MTREDVLRDETHKGGTDGLDRRVFYTLTDKKELQTHRTAKAVALLVELLRKKDVLDDEEIDELLFACVS